MLTDSGLRGLKPKTKRYYVSDGGGLRIEVFPDGKKRWRITYRQDGKQFQRSLGSYPNVRLAHARELRDDVKRNIARRLPAFAETDTPAPLPEETWNAMLADWLKKKRLEGLAFKTITKLERFADLTRPFLGDKLVRDITPQDILATCREQERKECYENSVRVLSLCRHVMRHSIIMGVAETDVTASVREALATPRHKCYAALTDKKEVGRLLLAIDEMRGWYVTKAALQLTALTFLRSKELREAQWPEISLENALWTIPAVRMKSDRDHLVPLADQSISILRTLHGLTAHKGLLIFASSHRTGRPISGATMNNALKDLGYTSDRHVPHGFRTTASTNLNEMNWNPDWIEKQLAHEERNWTRRAYNRSEYLPDRRRMMQAYADWLDKARSLAGE